MKTSRKATRLNSLLAFSLFFMALSPAMAAETPNVARLVALSTPRPFQHEEKIGARHYQVATVMIDAKPEAVWNVLTDYEDTAHIFSNVKKLKVLKASGSSKEIAFEVTSMGGLCKYDYVLNVQENEAEKRIEWSRNSGAFRINEGFWQLTPFKDGTLVTYAKYIDGGPLMPQMFVNNELRKTMPSIMTNLKEEVLKRHPHLAMKDNINNQ